MLLATSLPATSQSLRDYIRSRAGNADSLVIKAVSPALSIIRQQYRLERNGEYFGKNKLPFYGETYSLGVKVSGSTILQRTVVYPWENDEDYQRANKGRKYKPVYYKSFQRQWTEKEWNSVDLELGSQYVSILSPDSSLFSHSDAMSNFGLPIDETEGQKSGYLIWAYSSINPQDSSVQVKLHSSNYQIKVKSDSALVKIKPESTENLIGGIYVVPVVERAGYIKLNLVGIAVPKSQNEWFLNLLIKESGKVTKINESEKANRQKKKRKRSEADTNTDESAGDIEPTPIK